MATVEDLMSFLNNAADMRDLEGCHCLEDCDGGLGPGDAPIDRVEELISNFEEPQAACADASGSCMREETERALACVMENAPKQTDKNTLRKHLDQEKEPSICRMQFIVQHVIGRILNHDQWVTQREQVCQECVCGFVKHIQHLFDSKIKQDNNKSLQKTLSHFEGKEHLGEIIKLLWLFLSEAAPAGIIDPQMFIPLLRQLAMRDIIDSERFMVGEWKAALDHLEQELLESAPQTPIDDVLNSTTKILREGRRSPVAQNSIRLSSIFGESAAPEHCFKCSPKCSAKMCSNMESAAKPHPFRCRHCFCCHHCSEACLEHCE